MNMEATTLDTPLTSIWLEEIVGIRCLLQGSEGLDDSIARNAQSYWPDSKSLTIPQPLSKSTATFWEEVSEFVILSKAQKHQLKSHKSSPVKLTNLVSERFILFCSPDFGIDGAS